MSALRYAVLHHTDIAEPHYDLLFETDAASLLTTFRCPQWPPTVGDRLEETPEHRRIYLDYEGPISDGRGVVSRVDAGEIEMTELVADPPTIALYAASASGTTIELTLVHEYAADERHTLWTVAMAVLSPETA